MENKKLIKIIKYDIKKNEITSTCDPYEYKNLYNSFHAGFLDYNLSIKNITIDFKKEAVENGFSKLITKCIINGLKCLESSLLFEKYNPLSSVNFCYLKKHDHYKKYKNIMTLNHLLSIRKYIEHLIDNPPFENPSRYEINDTFSNCYLSMMFESTIGYLSNDLIKKMKNLFIKNINFIKIEYLEPPADRENQILTIKTYMTHYENSFINIMDTVFCETDNE